jgi:methionyl-tRNA formyltransferase
MDEGMDTGAMLLTRAVAIEPDETAGDLATRLAPIGADVMIDTLDRLDTLIPVPQQHDLATLAPRLKRADGFIDWAQPAHAIVNQVRGCNPWPGATTRTPRGALSILRATATPWAGREPPGTLVHLDGDGGVAGTVEAIATGDGALVPREVQPESRRAVAWKEFLRGARLQPGARFERP